MKTLILELDLHDQRDRQKAMSKASGISGVISVAIDMKEKKMTMVGEFDPVEVTSKLRKLCHADIVMVGENKEEKKDEGSTGGGGGGGDGGRVQVEGVFPLYWPANIYPTVVCEELNPITCVIC